MRYNKDYAMLLRTGRAIERRESFRRNHASAWIVGSCLAFAALLILTCLAFAVEIDGRDYSHDEITEAIGKAENSVRYPYGIKSIDTNGDVAYARRICMNSVRNNERRWINAGRPGCFIEFMSRRFCPIGAPDDPTGLNKHWSSNVKYFLTRNK